MQNPELNPKNLKSEKQIVNSETQPPTAPTYLRATTIWKSFAFAFAGIWYVLRTQRNAKIHASITTLVILLGLFLPVSATQWAILAVTIGMVFSAEMFNTVVEALVDLVCPTFHPLAKVAKDVAAGAVLLLAIMSVTVGLFIFGPLLWQLVEPFVF